MPFASFGLAEGANLPSVDRFGDRQRVQVVEGLPAKSKEFAGANIFGCLWTMSYAEAEMRRRMISVRAHDRIAGRPSRAKVLDHLHRLRPIASRSCIHA